MIYTVHVNLVTDMVAITMVFPLVVCVYSYRDLMVEFWIIIPTDLHIQQQGDLIT